MISHYSTRSELGTQRLAGNLIKKLIKRKGLKKPLILALFGNLGSGKTIFIKGLARGLGIKKKVTSPTFVIMKEYRLSYPLDRAQGKQTIHSRKLGAGKLSPNQNRLRRYGTGRGTVRYPAGRASYRIFYHIDCYRVGEEDILDLGWRNLIKDPRNIIAIEWADRIKKILPENAVKIRFRTMGENVRKITIEYKSQILNTKS